MLQLGQMQVESSLFFESVEEIYRRVFCELRPDTPAPTVQLTFRKYAGAHSQIRLANDVLTVRLTDIMQTAPAPIHEALASILLHKLFQRVVDRVALARYRRYLNRADVRTALLHLKRERGRKHILEPAGRFYDLRILFEELNQEYFGGLMARPSLGWSVRPSRTIFGHYDPSHHVIVLSNLLDSERVPHRVVRYVMFHEMLHLKYPTQHRGARRCVHTREFVAAEKSFKDYAAARRELKVFAEILAGKLPARPRTSEAPALTA